MLYRSLCALSFFLVLSTSCSADNAVDNDKVIRVATFNMAMGMTHQGELVAALQTRDDDRLSKVAAIVRQVNPDILLLNEFDYDDSIDAAALFGENYLGDLAYPWSFRAPVNTGVQSGLDLDGDGKTGGPGDAWGFGHFPGQYGMLVLSRHPIDSGQVRSYLDFRWNDLDGALRPKQPDGSDFYDDSTWEQLRLSSKSHWDIPIRIGQSVLHLLAFHPTPPVFDGPENRNGKRNFDEIRLWKQHIESLEAPFVIAGDFNADPHDGDSLPGAITQLTDSAYINNECTPQSRGAMEASEQQAGKNAEHQGNPAHDTADFNDEWTGNLRLDYVLPSSSLTVDGCGVFWPAISEPGHEWIDASDHRLVWVDIRL